MIYKVLNADGTSCNGGNAQWSLPTQAEDGTWTPGEWMPDIEGELVPCENGYHLCVNAQVIQWLGPVIYEAEYDGECVEEEDKIVVRRCRLVRRLDWDDGVARTFVRRCALQVAHLWDMPDIVRRYLETGDEALRAEANAAAWDALRDAARAAARAAARDAARDAANAAAWDAAWAAARDAAWDAARDAANAAAWDAANAAANAAARDAARAAQYTEFCRLTAGKEKNDGNYQILAKRERQAQHSA